MNTNCHSPLWGPVSTQLDHVGEIIEGGLLALNSQNSLSMFCSNVAHTLWIDVIAATLVLIPCIIEWVVWELVEVVSNHKMIVIQLFD